MEGEQMNNYILSEQELQLLQGCEPEEVQMETIYKKYLFDVTKAHKEPEPILMKDDKTVLTLGNFSCISGQAKSRKSFLITAITGAFLCDCGYLGFEGTNHTGTVLYCDTEQSEGHVNRVVNRIYKIANIPTGERTDKLTILALREADPRTRRKLIEYAITKLKPTLVVIDGVSDLFENGVNDEREAIEIVSELMRITSEFNCHILTALHTNPGTAKVRGHAGSEVTRKAETVLQVSKDGENSLVESTHSRDKDIDKFAFFITSEGLPMQTEVQEKSPSKEALINGFLKILPYPDSTTHTELTQRVMNEFGVKTPMAKRKIAQALNYKIIAKAETGLYHLIKAECTEQNIYF